MPDTAAPEARLLFVLTALLCGLAPIVAPGVRTLPMPAGDTAIEWPTHLYDEQLEPVDLSEKELRFVSGFPGSIRKFKTPSADIMIRRVMTPTRKLHPASDCYKGAGYRVKPDPIQIDRNRQRWGCITAAKGGRRLKVCERIYDQQGQEFTDVSAWYWHAVLRRSSAPWWAVTVAQEL